MALCETKEVISAAASVTWLVVISIIQGAMRVGGDPGEISKSLLRAQRHLLPDHWPWPMSKAKRHSIFT